MAFGDIELHQVVNESDSLPDKDLPTIKGKPEDVAKQFVWEQEVVMGIDKVDRQLTDFADKNPELNLDINKIIMTLGRANKMSQEIYDKIYENQVNKPDYHNAEHTSLTATEGLKIFLGGLAELYKDPDFKAMVDANPGKMQQLIDVAVYSMALHEIDDWWTRMSEDEITGLYEQSDLKNTKKREEITDDDISTLQEGTKWTDNQKSAKEVVISVCDSLGISTEDFNRLNILDTFFEPLETTTTREVKDGKEVEVTKEGSVDKVLKDEPLNKPYFKDTSGKPEFAWLGENKEVQRKFLKLVGLATRSADFLQIYNSKYYQRVELTDTEGLLAPEDTKTNLGSVALAQEYKDFRPNAGKPIGWINTDGSINWKKVGVGKFFLEKFALPNIRLGVNYLKNFDEAEGSRVDLITTDLEKVVGIRK